LRQLTDLFGYEWGEMMGVPTLVRLPDGERVIEMRLWFSTTTPRLEFVSRQFQPMFQRYFDTGKIG
jgi:hypothetical protein